MRSSRRIDASQKSSSRPLNEHNTEPELTSAWKSLVQTKTALRHIENRLEAAPGVGVCLDLVTDLNKKSSRTGGHRDVQQSDELESSRKPAGGSQQSPARSSSRSPLKNTTQNGNVRKNSIVDFREPLASYRDATPPHLYTLPEAYHLASEPGSSSSSPHSDPLSCQLVYQRDTRDKQTDRDFDTTRASAVESTEVRYLNDQPALDVLKPEGRDPKAQLAMDNQESGLWATPTAGSSHRCFSTPSTSPGSASQRLENLKRHQPDDKLEKLKERIRRQRKHLEEAAEKDRSHVHLEQPIAATLESNNASSNAAPTVKIRKIAAARPAPVYKGFNSTETKIKTPDGKVWKEDQFNNLSREVYRDLSRQVAESSKYQQQTELRAERYKEKRPSKPVRKIQKVAPASDLHSKPVISPASWREGQKLVQMVLGPAPKLDKESHRSHSNNKKSRAASFDRSKPHSCSDRQDTEGQRGEPTDQPTAKLALSSAAQGQNLTGKSTGLLSADIISMLDDLKLGSKPPEREERARKKSRGSQSSRRGRACSGSLSRTPVSAWGATREVKSSRAYRSVSPPTRQSEASTAEKGSKKRHYNAESVRQYIVRQQEERKKRQLEEKRAAKEEAEKRNQRLQELYKKQREVAKIVPTAVEIPVFPVQKRLQETFTKLLMEEARLGEVSRTQVASSIQMRPMYQPSGESDKENKRLEVPQSPSSSDKSLNDHPPPPLSRNDLDGGVAPLVQPERLCPTLTSAIDTSCNPVVPSNEYIFSQLLKLEAAVAAGNQKYTARPATSPYNSPQQPKMSRIEALKATATSLSNRIESEAQKLVGKGINYGAATSLDVDTTLAPRNTDVDIQNWAERLANATESDDMPQRIQRILTGTGYNSQNVLALPKAANLFDKMEKKEKTQSSVNYLHLVPADIRLLTSNTNRQEERNDPEIDERMDHGVLKTKKSKEENWVELNESSSISEGPLPSEGSCSEAEASPPYRLIDFVPRVDPRNAVDPGLNQRIDLHRLFEFQQDAATYAAFNPPFTHGDGVRAPWEELNKGSPLSVINIFTKNLPENVRVIERNSERNSPLAHPLNSENEAGNMVEYEDDFVSSCSSKVSDQSKKATSTPSNFEERLRSPLGKSSVGISSHHSPVHLSSHPQHISTGSTSGSSPHSRHSSRKKGTTSDQSDATLVEEQSSSSQLSEIISSESRMRSSDKSSAHSQDKNIYSNDILSESLKPSHQRSRFDSSSGSPDSISSGSNSVCESVKTNAEGATNSNILQPSASALSGRPETSSLTGLPCSPTTIQQRMTAELQYLESIEESIRQLGDVERLMTVSVVQQESASLVNMLKAKQHLQERELYELKIKAEREALETKLQLEENRQRVARAHMELQESLAASQRENLEALQASTTKMMSQQAEAARHTADAARHIKEITELARNQFEGGTAAPPAASVSAMLDQPDEHEAFTKSQEDKSDSDSEVSSRRDRSEVLTSPNSPSQSESFKRPHLSDATCSSSHHSPSHASPTHTERSPKAAEEKKQKNKRAENVQERETISSSIEEDIPKVANESLCSSLPSMIDEKVESMSVATEYSLKFDESMTEDEIEERSFRSLLPSEAHRRGTMEKKSRHQEESEEDGSRSHATPTSETEKHSSLKSQSVHIAFSGGQDSFSQFTMDMVRQYMEDEKARLRHQSSLLHLRQKALEEKTRTELAWLELQKKRLRDKGEDDKMPPIRKKQRGLLIKLQQEQAEIKRLQEANKAARKERRQLLKQQEEIERIRNSTLRLKERLKSAAPETSKPELLESDSLAANVKLVEDTRSSSPSVSVSGSETSCAMQKLKKMCPHKDEKFLTKRHQQLVQRHHDAQELLQWKQQLDQAEAEVRRIEKKALAAWDRTIPLDNNLPESQEKEVSEIDSNHHQSSEARTDSEKDVLSEKYFPSASPESSIQTEEPEAQQSESPTVPPPLSISETPVASIPSSPVNYTQDFTSVSQVSSKKSSPIKSRLDSVASPSDGSSKTKMQLLSVSQEISEVPIQPTDLSMAMPSETTSDQSDIEGRIKALREELKKRKFMAYQLKKEQKKRHKERLKAQEASLLKKLENYNIFIEKTTAELNKEPESTHNTSSQIKDSSLISEQSSIKPYPLSPDSKDSFHSEKTLVDASFSQSGSPPHDHIRSTALQKDFSYRGSFSPLVSGGSQYSIRQLSESPRRSSSSRAESGDAENISEIKSDVLEELISEINSKLEDESSHHLLKLEKLNQFDSQERLSTPDHALSFVNQKHKLLSSSSLEEYKDVKSSKISEADENLATVPSSDQPQVASVNFETSQHPSQDLSSGTDSCSQELSIVSHKEAPTKNLETSAEADGYFDDFESPNDSQGEEQHSSKQSSSAGTEISKKDSVSGFPVSDNQDEVEEEEIAEELSKHSEVTENSHQSERLLDLSQHSKDVDADVSINSNQISAASTSQPSLSPVVDEMPDFNIGDRVLVGGVQPGTLRFKGPTSFANGFWAGLELDKSEGSNNGTYDGVVYFNCKDRHGIFAPPDKITHLPEKFVLYTDTAEDDDSFVGDTPVKSENKNTKSEESSPNQRNLESENDQVLHKDTKSRDATTDEENQVPPKNNFHLNLEHHKESKPLIFNGNKEDIVLECEDTLQTFISDSDKLQLGNEANKETITPIERVDTNSPQHSAQENLITVPRCEDEEQKDREFLGACTDKILNDFVEETVKQFTEMKKMKEEKIRAANQLNEWKLTVCDEGETWMTSVDQKDGLPFVPRSEKDEFSSPELHNPSQSPVFGIGGQEELAKRLAELELSREILDDLGDDQDWFDEDFGLSSHREQQRLKQKEEEAQLDDEPDRLSMGGLVSSISGESPVKIPPRPELPLPLPPKLPEQPAMVVPHSATEVKKMVDAAIMEIWDTCGLGKDGVQSLVHLENPTPSLDYLGKEFSSQDQEDLSIRSYRKAVYDLTWEILQEVFAEDPNTNQPHWVKSRRVKSSLIHRVKMSGDFNKIQEFVTTEVLKLYGLTQDQNQKTEWQKMLKFGKKKRDRVDHILVYELHEEEAQWVNYDEDELFVKIQLADSIFDSLLKDTLDTFTLISEKRSKRSSLS